jgi:hypothetical protein
LRRGDTAQVLGVELHLPLVERRDVRLRGARSIGGGNPAALQALLQPERAIDAYPVRSFAQHDHVELTNACRREFLVW